jgi:cytosine/adenosine deaminase-related metal-dependent hydrolase
MNDELSPGQFQAAEQLLIPEHVLLRDGPHCGYAVVVRGGRFVDVGPAEAVIERHRGIAATRLPGKLLMPGLVDAHHHLTQSFGKALAFGEPSEIFRRVWVPLERSLDDRLVHMTAKLAALESLRGGFTTVCDAGTRAKGSVDAIAAATGEAGLRCVLGLICNDIDADEQERGRILARARDHLGRWNEKSLIHPSLAISIPEVATDGMLHSVSSMCAEARAVFQTHVNEHLAAVERSLVARGKRPLELLHHVGALGPQALLAHATMVTPFELNMLRETDTAVSYNPVASQWKGNAVAPAVQMAALGIRFGLGTDSTRSDGFRLIDAAEAVQKIAFALDIGDASTGAGWMWLDHATWRGADAVGLGAVTGEIAIGKAADYLLVDLDVPEMQPSFDLGWELVRLANRDQIVAVFVAGKLRLWRGWPVDWDARALLREVAGTAGDAVAQAPIHKVHPASDAHRAEIDARGWIRPLAR